MGIFNFAKKETSIKKVNPLEIYFQYLGGDIRGVKLCDFICVTTDENVSNLLIKLAPKKTAFYSFPLSQIEEISIHDSLPQSNLPPKVKAKKFIVVLCKYTEYTKKRLIFGIVPKSKGYETLFQNISQRIQEIKKQQEIEMIYSRRPPSYFPRVFGEYSCFYSYGNITITPTEEQAALYKKMQEANEWELSLDYDGASLFALYENQKYGEIISKKEMFVDFINRNDPIRIWANPIDPKDTKISSIKAAFYRNPSVKYAHCESDIVRLEKFKSEDRQQVIGLVREGERLDFEEDDYEGKNVVSSYEYGAIGTLPARVVKKIVAESYADMFFDHVDYTDDEQMLYVPYIKIYW